MGVVNSRMPECMRPEYHSGRGAQKRTQQYGEDSVILGCGENGKMLTGATRDFALNCNQTRHDPELAARDFGPVEYSCGDNAVVQQLSEYQQQPANTNNVGTAPKAKMPTVRADISGQNGPIPA